MRSNKVMTGGGDIQKSKRDSANKISQSCNANRGFTLMEMMVVVSIIGILAAIAIPSYRRYVIINAERETQAKMMQVQIQLERWRASALSYKGFVPQLVNGSTTSYAYDETDNKTIYVPSGSTASNYRYKITLVSFTPEIPASKDGPAVPAIITSLVADKDSVNITTGRSWKMLATPYKTGINNAHYIILASDGLRCQSITEVKIDDDDCGAFGKEW